MLRRRFTHWIRMRRFLVRFSESEASNHTPSLADFTTTTPELKFSIYTTTALRQKLPLAGSKSNFHLIPETGLNSAIAACPKCANMRGTDRTYSLAQSDELAR
jgi:hypothetical protein